MITLKLGPHMLPGGESDTGSWLSLKPTVVKFFYELYLANDAPAETLCLGRPEENFIGMHPMLSGDPVILACEMARDVYAPLIKAYPAMDAWEGPNEVNPSTVEEMQWYSAFLAELGKQIYLLGKRAALGAWAVGTPEMVMWQYYGPVLQACLDYRSILSRHSYGPLDEWYSYRHRKDEAEFRKLGYKNSPLIISECGGDNLGDQELRFRDHWGDQWSGNLEGYWLQYLKPFTEEISKDAYVIGATLFTVGTGFSDVWKPFDVAGHPQDKASLSAIIQQYPPEVKNMPPAGATHQVTATVLNVRQFPWSGTVEPPIVGTLLKDEYVTSYSLVKFGTMQYGWHDISTDSNRWVSGKYLKPIAETVPTIELVHDDPGIDVSFYQKSVDWEKVKESGIKFVFVKSSEGSFTDKMFTTHWAGAGSAKLMRGAYHYFRSGVDPIVQARQLTAKTFDAELELVLDVETQNIPVPQKVFADQVLACLKEIERLSNKRPMIYTGSYVWTELTGNPTWASDYPLWIGQYPFGDVCPTLEQIQGLVPSLPTGWTSYAYWQYTSKGQVAGITGLVDLNVFNK